MDTGDDTIGYHIQIHFSEKDATNSGLVTKHRTRFFPRMRFGHIHEPILLGNQKFCCTIDSRCELN